MGLRTVAVYSEADAGAAHVALADEAHCIGPAAAAESYLVPEAILAAARSSGAGAIHPGYGFLSENAAFAEACDKAGVTFVGPPADAIRAMGLKDRAKALMADAGVPVVPGYHGDDQSPDLLAAEAEKIGYPVLIKAVAGGGGKGMRRVDAAVDFSKALESAMREAKSAFGDERVLIEKFVTRPRHIEVQVFADSHGNVVHLFERDCSVQRRHQKVLEEAPAPGMPADMREAMGKAACEAARAIGYRGAGTVEFIADASDGLRADRFYFMEMNTRLQVEHPVTEMVTGLDLVEWQLRVAAGDALPMAQEEIGLDGHAIEARLYAEDPAKQFFPSTGRLDFLRLPEDSEGVRVDSGVRQGDEVTVFYDPMIAKIIAWDETREGALARLGAALRATRVAGVTTNAGFLAAVAGHPVFAAGEMDTGFIDTHLDALVPKDAAPGADDVALAALGVLRPRAEDACAAAGRSGDPYSPWNRLDGWRVAGRAEERLTLLAGDTAFEVGVTYGAGGYSISVGGDARDAAYSDGQDGELVAVLDGTKVTAHVIADDRRVTVMRDGAVWHFERPDPLAADALDPEAAGAVTAPMPGKVTQVWAEAGKRVKRGDALVALEAMKMEHTLTAPADLTVEEVMAAAGDQVDGGAVLVTFEAPGD